MFDAMAIGAGFDPRSRAGSDVGLRGISVDGGSVSIRAPARGATTRKQRKAHAVRLFRSALPRGERRHRARRVELARQRFDPRSRAGSDAEIRAQFRRMEVSIRAPARGATASIAPARASGAEFRSALPRGERRRSVRPVLRCARCFDPRSRAGSDVAGKTIEDLEQGFDPRSRAGSDFEPV